jgi:hypothetical protein
VRDRQTVHDGGNGDLSSFAEKACGGSWSGLLPFWHGVCERLHCPSGVQSEETMLNRHTWFAIGHVVALLIGSFGCQEPKKPGVEIETPKAKIEIHPSSDGTSVEIQTERPAETP